QIQSDAAVEALGQLVFPLPGHLAARDPFGARGEPPVAHVLAVNDRDYRAGAVIVADLVLGDLRAVCDEQGISFLARLSDGRAIAVAGGVQDVQLGAGVPDLDALYFGGLFRSEQVASELNDAVGELEVHARQGAAPLADGLEVVAVSSAAEVIGAL